MLGACWPMTACSRTLSLLIGPHRMHRPGLPLQGPSRSKTYAHGAAHACIVDTDRNRRLSVSLDSFFFLLFLFLFWVRIHEAAMPIARYVLSRVMGCHLHSWPSPLSIGENLIDMCGQSPSSITTRTYSTCLSFSFRMLTVFTTCFLHSIILSNTDRVSPYQQLSAASPPGDSARAHDIPVPSIRGTPRRCGHFLQHSIQKDKTPACLSLSQGAAPPSLLASPYSLRLLTHPLPGTLSRHPPPTPRMLPRHTTPISSA